MGGVVRWRVGRGQGGGGLGLSSSSPGMPAGGPRWGSAGWATATLGGGGGWFGRDVWAVVSDPMAHTKAAYDALPKRAAHHSPFYIYILTHFKNILRARKLFCARLNLSHIN